MTRAQLDLIPDRLLYRTDTTSLREWLHARGWPMTLLELDQERRRRRQAHRNNERNHR